MKKVNYHSFFLAAALASTMALTSCKDKSKTTTTDTPATTSVDSSTTTSNPPVAVSPDDALSRGAQDAAKDFPGVTTSVTDGVIYVSGTIERANWVKLNQSLQGLSPKQVDSKQLTIK